MKKKCLTTYVIIGAFFGAVVTFLAVHESTRKKIVKHTKIAHKKALKAIKENVKKIEVE